MIHILKSIRQRSDEIIKQKEEEKEKTKLQVQRELMEELQTPDYKEEFDEFIRFILFDLNTYDRQTLFSRWRQYCNMLAIKSSKE